MRRKRTIDPTLVVDYKNPDILKRFITDRGKIIPRRISGATASQQRAITVSIKRARFLGLLPYSVAHRTERGFAGEMQLAAQTFSAGGYRSRGPRPDRDRGDRPTRTASSDAAPETKES
jgi:small subunit ribosomal protein S18